MWASNTQPIDAYALDRGQSRCAIRFAKNFFAMARGIAGVCWGLAAVLSRASLCQFVVRVDGINRESRSREVSALVINGGSGLIIDTLSFACRQIKNPAWNSPLRHASGEAPAVTSSC